jgi:hypothetical protein
LPTGGGAGVGTITPGGGGTPSGVSIGQVKPQPDTAAELSFSVDRNELFMAWNAIVNLADVAGEVHLTIRASASSGF